MKRNNAEEKLQNAVCEHLRKRGVPGLVWWHSPNGGKRGVVEAVRLKRMGVRAGVADLILLHGGNAFALELKAEEGRLSEAQDEFLADFRAAGGFAWAAFGLDNAIKILESWQLVKGGVA